MSDAAGAQTGSAPPRKPRRGVPRPLQAASSRLRRSFLRFPLFYKILLANSAIVILGAVAGTWLARQLLRPGAGVPTPLFVGLIALAGVAITLLVNALILRLALTPLALLEETAARVQAGDLDARAPHSALSDRELERLTGTFNGMLDNLEGYRQRLREVAARALNAEEEERKRIARELHDDTAQTLAALLIRLRVLRSAAGSGAPAEELEQFRVQLADALERVRRFARGLRPPALDELGLVPALESHVRVLSESVGTPIRMEAESTDGMLHRQTELALYRIAQEALSNAVRHAGAREIRITIARRGDAVAVEVVDDGAGFDADAVRAREGRGLGLFGMEERASYVGGQVEVISRLGAGTRVTATVPVAGAAARDFL